MDTALKMIITWTEIFLYSFGLLIEKWKILREKEGGNWLSTEIFLVQHMKTNMNMEDGIQGHLFAEQDFLDKGKPVLNQPPLSQSDSAFLEPESPEEVSWV